MNVVVHPRVMNRFGKSSVMDRPATMLDLYTYELLIRSSLKVNQVVPPFFII